MKIRTIKAVKIYGIRNVFWNVGSSVIMSILAMLGKIAWGGLAVGIGLMIVGLIISKMK